jgi:hypothetical protein
MALDWTYFEENKGTIERVALDWNPQGASRTRKTWEKTIEEEAAVMGKTWKEVKKLANNCIRWRCFTDSLCSR